MNCWQNPGCIVISESNYSDAFIFPYICKQYGIAKLIGMLVAGTTIAILWKPYVHPTLVFGIPMMTTIGKENRSTKNLQVELDIQIPLKYKDFLDDVDA